VSAFRIGKSLVGLSDRGPRQRQTAALEDAGDALTPPTPEPTRKQARLGSHQDIHLVGLNPLPCPIPHSQHEHHRFPQSSPSFPHLWQTLWSAPTNRSFPITRAAIMSDRHPLQPTTSTSATAPEEDLSWLQFLRVCNQHGPIPQLANDGTTDSRRHST